jgi:hypothetical protein
MMLFATQESGEETWGTNFSREGLLTNKQGRRSAGM